MVEFQTSVGARSFYFYVFIYLGRASRLVGSQFPDQGSNLGPGSESPES